MSQPIEPIVRRSLWLRLSPVIAVAALALLSACATDVPVDQSQEAARYRAHAHNYTPPGPPEDPWGPYIREASARFDVPDRWIRQVMRQESGGKLYHNGMPTTSPVGAMGLMQVMPQTYDGLRARYDLGDEPYNPYDNILAGTAYIREMYDLYGNPGFLAAYNAGPRRVDDYLTYGRVLPAETRHYVAMIGPYIADAYPQHRSDVDLNGTVNMPINLPATGRGTTQYASSPASRGAVQVAMIPAPPRLVAPPAPGVAHSPAPTQVAAVPPPPPTAARGKGFAFIPHANAAEPSHSAGSGWAIQVGAYGNESLARTAAGNARGAAGGQPAVASVQQGKATLYRARVTGLSRDAAVQACQKLKAKGGCTVLSPDGQI